MGDEPMSSLKKDYTSWVTALRRDSSLRQKLARLTFGNAFSSWPTPRAHEVGDWQRDNGIVGMERLTLSGEAANWPTPRGEDGERAGNHPGATDSLTGAVDQWQTPGTDSFRSRGGDRKDEQGLDQQARDMWSTPHANSATGASSEGRDGGENIQTQVEGWDPWPTAGANDWKGTAKVGQRRWQLDEAAEQKFPSFRPDLAPSNNGSASSKSPRRLNPLFVEWLMGWPIGWTSVDHNGSALRATVWYRWSRLMRGALSELGSLAE